MTRRQNLNFRVLYNRGTGLRPTEIIRSDQVGGHGMRRTSQGIVARLETKPTRAGVHRHTHTYILLACSMDVLTLSVNSGQQAHAQGKQADTAQVTSLSGKCSTAPESALQSSSNLCSFC